MVTFSRLRLCNAIVGLVQLVAGIVLLGINPYNAKGQLPWYSDFIASWSRDQGTADEFFQPVLKKQVNFPIGVFSGVFLLLSAADHLFVTLPGINSKYNRLMCENRNPFRWAEYAVSASLMQVMIAQLCGITNIQLLFSQFFLMATTMGCGWVMERVNGSRLPTYIYTEDMRVEPKQRPDGAALPSALVTDGRDDDAAAPGAVKAAEVDWSPFILGCMPFLASTVVVACYFFQAVANSSPPGFVWSIFFILFALYALFAVNQVLQFKQVKGWRGFARAELWYMLLSLTSKQLLAWINFGGTMRFQSEA